MVATEGKKDQVQVLLDENLVRGSCESPLYINAADKVGRGECSKNLKGFPNS